MNVLAEPTAPAGLQPTGGGNNLADLPPPVAFTLPTPPSVNSLFRNLPGRGRVKTAGYDDFVRRGVASIRQQKVVPVVGYVVAVFAVERLKHMATADIDNRLKSMLDTIVKAGVIEDDHLITATLATWAPPANGLAHVQLFPIAGPVTFTFHPSPDGASGGIFVAPQLNGEDDGYQPI